TSLLFDTPSAPKIAAQPAKLSKAPELSLNLVSASTSTAIALLTKPGLEISIALCADMRTTPLCCSAAGRPPAGSTKADDRSGGLSPDEPEPQPVKVRTINTTGRSAEISRFDRLRTGYGFTSGAIAALSCFTM